MILAAVGLFAVTRGVTMLGIALFVIGLLKLFRVDFRGKPLGFGRRADDWQSDAVLHDVRVPRDTSICRQLDAIYAQRLVANAHSSPLRTELDDLIRSMWTELRTASSYDEWRRILRRVRDALAEPAAGIGGGLDDSIERLRRASSQWRFAQREVYEP